MAKKDYAGYECGDFLGEMKAIKDELSRSGSITWTRFKKLNSKLNGLLLAVGMSPMGNGHGQKESIYQEAVIIYQMITDCLLLHLKRV